jgi:hypothetical protein
MKCGGISTSARCSLDTRPAHRYKGAMILRKPPLNSIRRKFLWWPRKICLIYNELRPEHGATLQPFVPGFHQAYPGAYVSRAQGNKNNTGQCGGSVMSPVNWRVFAEYDGWYWLEWIVQQRQVSSTGDPIGEGTVTKWRVIQPRKQWNLWHEYFD